MVDYVYDNNVVIASNCEYLTVTTFFYISNMFNWLIHALEIIIYDLKFICHHEFYTSKAKETS